MKAFKKFFLIIFASAMLIACSSEDVKEEETIVDDGKIRMSDYLDYKFAGPNGEGIVKSNFDYESFAEDIADENPWIEDLEEGFFIQTLFDFEVKPRSQLSNGDKVTIEFFLNENYDFEGINTKALNLEVEDLEIPTEFDTKKILDNLDIKFEGVSGEGVMDYHVIDRTGPFEGLEFDLENYENLSNGDVVEMYFRFPKYYDPVGKKMYRASENPAKIKVKGLPEDKAKDGEYKVFDLSMKRLHNFEEYKERFEEDILDYAGDNEVEFIDMFFRPSSSKKTIPAIPYHKDPSERKPEDHIGFLVAITESGNKYYEMFMVNNTTTESMSGGRELNIGSTIFMTNTRIDGVDSLKEVYKILEEDGFKAMR